MSVLLEGSTSEGEVSWAGKWYYIKDTKLSLPFQYKRVGDTIPSDLLEYVSFYGESNGGGIKVPKNNKQKSKAKSAAFKKAKSSNIVAESTATEQPATKTSTNIEVGSSTLEGASTVSEDAPPPGATDGEAAAAAAAAAPVDTTISVESALGRLEGLKPVRLGADHPYFGLWEGTFDVTLPTTEAEYTVTETFFLHSYLGKEVSEDLKTLPAEAHYTFSALKTAPVQLLPTSMMPTQLCEPRSKSGPVTTVDTVAAESAQAESTQGPNTAKETQAPVNLADSVKMENTLNAEKQEQNEASKVDNNMNESSSAEALPPSSSEEVDTAREDAVSKVGIAAAGEVAVKHEEEVTDGSGSSPLTVLVGFGRNRFGRFSLTATVNPENNTFIAEKRYMLTKSATSNRKNRNNYVHDHDPATLRARSYGASGMSLSDVMPPNSKRKRGGQGYKRGLEDFAYGDDEEFYSLGGSGHGISRRRSQSTSGGVTASAQVDTAPQPEALDPEDDVDFRGSHYDEQTGEVYEGGWHNGRRHGRGVCLYADGSMYEGQWSNGKECGHGVLMIGDRKVLYTGEWMDGLMHGNGTYNFFNGDRYQGDWREGNRHGKGEFVTHDGCKYVGDWKENRRSGRGVFTWPDGSQYDGEWDEDSRHGKGHLKLKKGFIYDGTWSRNFFDGRGVAVFPSGQKYEGTYRAGLREGRGSINFPEGAVYEGRFRDDRLDGQGTIKITENVAGPEKGERFIPLEIQADMRRIHLKAGFGFDLGH
eukprot:GSChrysophyteH1.ASY1.ANO1.441.1 assembled CDS